MVRLKRMVVCATRPLRPQNLIGPEDIQIMHREVTGLNVDDFFTTTEQVVGHILAKSVGPQEIITTRHSAGKVEAVSGSSFFHRQA